MLPLCDYVVVVVCLTPDTMKMFGADQFKLMKPTSVFVNISRGICTFAAILSMLRSITEKDDIVTPRKKRCLIILSIGGELFITGGHI